MSAPSLPDPAVPHVFVERGLGGGTAITRELPKPPPWTVSDARYRYRYWQSSRWRWFAMLGKGIASYQGGLSAVTEQRLRNKIARFIRRERLRDELRRNTERCR